MSRPEASAAEVSKHYYAAIKVAAAAGYDGDEWDDIGLRAVWNAARIDALQEMIDLARGGEPSTVPTQWIEEERDRISKLISRDSGS